MHSLSPFPIRLGTHNTSSQKSSLFHFSLLCLFFFLILFSQTCTAQIKVNPKVIGGSIVNPSNYSVAALVSSQGDLCSGSVVSRRSILTASHCAFIASKAGSFAYIRGVKYPLQGGRRAPGGIDVGIVRTTVDIKASRFEVPQGIKAPIGQRFLLLGFGDPNPGRLSQGYMTVSSYPNSNEFIASSYKGQNACPGDSGGPAIVSYRGRASIIGVVSRGPQGCRSGNSVVFPMTTTDRMARWIRQNG
jgi:hypothetical protein